MIYIELVEWSEHRKPNDRPLYVHRQSNHPPCIIKNLPAAISRRLTDISSDREAFKEASPLYENALKESGYNDDLDYIESRKTENRRNRRKRQRKIIWFNPPFSRNVASNIGRRFLCLVQKHFPRGSKLHKIFNYNTLKVSYSCMSNMRAVIRRHNNYILSKDNDLNSTDARTCNCRRKDQCPLDGLCLTQCIVYKATVHTADESEQKEYTGLTATTFKQRYSSHQQSLRHRDKQNSTALSKHVWSLKDAGKEYSIKWSVHRKAAAYSNKTKRCNLCLAEKLAIINADKARSLNKRSELVSKCRHENKYYLSNFVCDPT